MYLTPLMTAVTEALRATFTTSYPEPDFRSINIDIAYPMTEQAYPGLWVQYEDKSELSIAGINHVETSIDPVAHTVTQVTRWKFEGTVTITCVALTSLERDRLYDELVRTFAFSRQNVALSPFRSLIEQNDLIGMKFNFDNLMPSGTAAAMGTPWGTEEVIYEKSLSMDVIGEFVGDPYTRQIVPLSRVLVTNYIDGTPAPNFPDGQLPRDEVPTEFDPSQWH